MPDGVFAPRACRQIRRPRTPEMAALHVPRRSFGGSVSDRRSGRRCMQAFENQTRHHRTSAQEVSTQSARIQAVTSRPRPRSPAMRHIARSNGTTHSGRSEWATAPHVMRSAKARLGLAIGTALGFATVIVTRRLQWTVGQMWILA